MNPAIYAVIMLWIIIFIMYRNKRNSVIAKMIIKNRKTGDSAEMKTLATRFIDKECMIYSFDGRQFTGTIKEVEERAILVENKGKAEAINLDYIIRIREYPVNKKGKKKSVVLD